MPNEIKTNFLLTSTC